MPAKKIELICGYHAVRHVLERRPQDVLEVFISSGKQRSAKLDELLGGCERNTISVQPVSPAKLDRMLDTTHHQGIAARCRQPDPAQRLSIDDLCATAPKPDAMILALDRVMDPHNLGACIRTAEAAGVDAVLLPKSHSAPLSSVVSKVASGALENVTVIKVANLARALRQLRTAGYHIIGACGSAGKTIYQVGIRFPAVLVMGSEEAGLRRNTREHCDELVRIPMRGSVESLNLSVAAGVCLYEFRRQGC